MSSLLEPLARQSQIDTQREGPKRQKTEMGALRGCWLAEGFSEEAARVPRDGGVGANHAAGEQSPPMSGSGTCRGQEARCWNGWKSSGESRSRTRGRTGVFWAAEESLRLFRISRHNTSYSISCPIGDLRFL